MHNDTIHRDLKIDIVEEKIKKQATKHVYRIHNSEMLHLLDNIKKIHCLKKKKLFDLCRLVLFSISK